MIMSSSFSIEPITPAIGAEIDGLDTRDLNNGQVSALREALNRYKVILLRNQNLDLDTLCAFSERFGELMQLPYIEPVASHPTVIRVLKQAEEINMGVFGGEWHSDFSFLEEPPSYSVLYARDVPPLGGDTLWVNMVKALEQLPLALRAQLKGVCAVHTGTPYGTLSAPDPSVQFKGSINIQRNNPEADKETLHPVICTHPETGEQTLFINPTYTIGLKDSSELQNDEWLQKLINHCMRPEIGCRIRWRTGTLALWDNRTTMHYAVNDYDGHRREMWRTTIRGHKPIMAA